MTTKNIVSDYRTRIYSSYRSSHELDKVADDRANRAPYLRNLISKYLPPNRATKILDLGCGSGTLLYFLRIAGYHNIAGVDTSAEQVVAAHELGIEEVVHGDLFETLKETTSGSLDVTIAFDVIEHLTKAELFDFADEVYRVLGENGQWIIHTPNADSPFGVSVRYRDWTHEQIFSPSSLKQILRVVGFAQIVCLEDQPIPHGTKSTIRWLLWQVVRNIWRFIWAIETGYTDRNGVYSQNLLVIATKYTESMK